MRIHAFLLALALTLPVSAQKSLSDGIKDLAGQIAASATKAEKQKIAALPFRDLDGTPTVLGTYLAEALSTHLVNAGLEVVERTLLDKVLTELKLQQTGAIDAASAKQVGKVAGVDAIITGSIANLNAVLAINCRLIDTQTGRIFAAAETMITRDAMVESIIGQVRTTTAPPSATKGAPKKAGKPTWPHDNTRVVMDKVNRVGTNRVEIILAFENDAETELAVTVGKYHLLDDNGERWGLMWDSSGFVRDGVNIPAQSRARSTFTFECNAGECNGTSFSVLLDGKIVLRDLKI